MADIEWGYTKARFRQLTVRQYALLFDRWLSKEDRLNYRASLVGACVLNAQPRKRGSTVQPHDLIKPLRSIKPVDEMPADERIYRTLVAAFGPPKKNGSTP